MPEFVLNVAIIFAFVYIIASILNYSQSTTYLARRLEKEKIRNIHVKAITGKYLTEKEWEIVQSISEQSCDSDYPYNKET